MAPASAVPAGAHPFGTGAWRAPGNNTNTFARESQIDIMAAAAGMDPVEFRLKNLSDTRMIRVLKAAAEKFGWKPAKAPSKRGYGVACGIDAGTYVATIAEVAVDAKKGTVQVKRVVCAQDMGVVINPRRREDPDGRLHHDGPGLCPDRGSPFQGRQSPRHELRHLRNPALLLGAEDRDRDRSGQRDPRRKAAASRRSSSWAP